MKIDPARYQLPKSTRQSENIEWTTSYIYNRNDLKSPRVLLIGDSICNGYQAVLRQKLADSKEIFFKNVELICIYSTMYWMGLPLIL